ncbi:MAG: hypothetical protein JW797_14315 [Bradymonadales bacterium]|nr:hypothetical protein [Bradymonadales bacterium]
MNLAIQLSLKEVRRYLGYRRQSSPNRRVAERLDALWEQAEQLVQPRGGWRIISGDQARSTGMPRPSEQVGIGLVTIGPALEEEVGRCNDRGDLLDGLILDAYGSAAAEAAADALDRELCAVVRELGYRAERRISPGYGRWKVNWQVELLAWLPAEELGIRLTPGCMMIPRKSVSFAVRCLPPAVGTRIERHRCEGCDRRPCPYSDREDGREEAE